MNDPLLAVVYTLNVFCAALWAGGLAVVWIGELPLLRRLDYVRYVEAKQIMDKSLTPYMGGLLFAVALSAFGVVLLTARSATPRTFNLALAGLLLHLAQMASTLAINVPINIAVSKWSATSPPAGWERMRARWATFHVMRTVLSLVALLCFIASAVWT